MSYFTKSTTCLVLALFFCLIVLSPGNSAEIDDATVFVDAFNAFQQKDYLLAIEKCEQLNQAFPDSPLRDVTLLLIARASLKSGDNERAAKTIVLFSSEFPDSSLKTTIEDELLVLARRHQEGEALSVDKTLQSAAQKVNSDRVARVKAAELKLELERVLAEKRAKASINASISFPEAVEPFPVGTNGTLLFSFSNRGKDSEDFLLTVATAKEYDAVLSYAGKPVERDTRLQISPGETIKGTIVFKIPAEMVDGHRSVIMIKAVSAKFRDVSFQKETVVISSAPLVRAIAKFAKQKITPGEKLRYRVTVVNAGSVPAQNLTVRIQLPLQVDFQGAPDVLFKQEPNGTLVFKIDQVEAGKLAEINLDVKVREDCAIGLELRGHVEIGNDNLQRKDVFTTAASVVQTK